MSENKNQTEIGRQHWIVFLPPFVLLTVAVLIFVFTGSLKVSAPFLFFGISIAFINGVSFRYTELSISPSAVVIQRGMITRNTLEIPFLQIESVDVIQNIAGQLFDYGALRIVGTGGTITLIPQLNHPTQWRQKLQSSIAYARTR